MSQEALCLYSCREMVLPRGRFWGFHSKVLQLANEDSGTKKAKRHTMHSVPGFCIQIKIFISKSTQKQIKSLANVNSTRKQVRGPGRPLA